MTCLVAWRKPIACCLLFLTAHPVNANQFGPGDVCGQTDLDLTFISQNVTSRAREVPEDAFLACVSAIQAMLNLNKHRLTLQHMCSENHNNGHGASARFGSLEIVRGRDEKDKHGGDVIKIVNAEQRRNADWREQFNCKLPTSADFDKLLVWMFANVIEPDKTGAYAAAAINGYIGVGDIYARGFALGNTCMEVRRELHKLMQQNIDGLILDLRDNSGGRIDQADSVSYPAEGDHEKT